jgi:hypothetical protein
MCYHSTSQLLERDLEKKVWQLMQETGLKEAQARQLVMEEYSIPMVEDRRGRTRPVRPLSEEISDENEDALIETVVAANQKAIQQIRAEMHPHEGAGDADEKPQHKKRVGKGPIKRKPKPIVREELSVSSSDEEWNEPVSRVKSSRTAPGKKKVMVLQRLLSAYLPNVKVQAWGNHPPMPPTGPSWLQNLQLRHQPRQRNQAGQRRVLCLLKRGWPMKLIDKNAAQEPKMKRKILCSPLHCWIRKMRLLLGIVSCRQISCHILGFIKACMGLG